MCGRTSLTSSPDDIAEAFGLDEVPDLAPRYNIAPTQPIPIVVLTRDGGRELHEVRFGLVPFWDKDMSSSARHINARVETVLTKRPFAEPIRKRRCLVVADAFYEWKNEPGPRGARKAVRQPYRIHFEDGAPFAFAGVYDRWRTKDGEVIESCSIITGPSRGPVAELHDRMPLVVPKDGYAAWLEPESDAEAMLAAMVESTPEWRVDRASRYLNDPRHEGPACIDPKTDESAAMLPLWSTTK
jgi:putative SOS response-associated peptidase YedK